MKNIFVVIIIVLFSGSNVSFSQEMGKKQLREKRKIERQAQIDSLINNRKFVFVARTAMPEGYKSIDLTTNSNYLKFSSDTIISEMPFFGRAYTGVGYNGDAGLHFNGKPEKYILDKVKNNYEIKVNVKGPVDFYQLYLTVSTDGSATLSITSNNRSTISYFGDISPMDKMR